MTNCAECGVNTVVLYVINGIVTPVCSKKCFIGLSADTDITEPANSRISFSVFDNSGGIQMNKKRHFYRMKIKNND